MEEVYRRTYSTSLLSSFKFSFVLALETTKHPAKSGWIQQGWSHQRRGKGEIQDGEKTALIVDPEGKDGAIKREEEQKGERRRLRAEYSDVLRRQTNVWVEFGLHADCRCPSLIPLCVFVVPCSTSADSFWVVSLRHR